MVRLIAALVLALSVLSPPVQAQRIAEDRDPTGKLKWTYNQEGNRVVRRDPTGRMLDYSVRSGNAIENRTPTGNLISRETRR